MIKTFSQVVFPLITFPYITRTLSAENIGKINFGSSIISYFSLIASLGISTYAIRECAKKKNRKEELSIVASQLFSINIFMTIISYFAFFVTLLFAKPLYNYRNQLIVQSFSIVCTTLGADWLNSAMEDFRYISIRTLAFQLLSLILMFLLIHEPSDYMKYVWITVFSSGGANILNVFYRRKYCNIRITRNLHLKQHWKPIITMFVLLLSQNIFVSSDQTILGLFRGDTEVGIYSTAVKIYNLVNTVIASIAFVIMPQMTQGFEQKNYEKINSLYKYSAQFIIGLGLPCIIGLNLLSIEIIELIGGTEYLAAVPILHILTLSLAIMFLSGLAGNIVLLPSGNDKYFLIACIISAAVNFITNIIFIPNYGMNAAAWTTVLSQFIVLIIVFIYADKKVDLFCFIRMLPDSIFSCFGMTAVVILIRYFITNIYLRTFFSIAAGAAMYFALMLLRKNELAMNIASSIIRTIRKILK